MILLAVFCGNLFLSTVAGFDPCTSHVTINEPQRSIENVRSQGLLCDRLLKPGWTRFQDAEMPFNTCIKPYHCGTHIPIWLQGNIPTVSDGIVEVTACGDMNPGNSNCCEYTYPIRVKNCGTYMVYDLLATIGCSIAYCAGKSGQCTRDKYSSTGFEPCADAYPKLSDNPVLGVPEVITGDFKFNCHIPYPPQVHDADFAITWLTDGVPITGLQTLNLRGNAVRDAIITGDQLNGQLGKSLSCAVTTSYSDNRTGVVSPPWNSNSYWMGVKFEYQSLHLHATGGEKSFQLVSSVPVVCQGPGTCNVNFNVYTDNDGIVMRNCEIQLRPTDWETTSNTATTDLNVKPRPGARSSQTQLTTTHSTNNVGSIWQNLQVPPANVYTTPGAGASCTLTGDPHIRTFDKSKRYTMLTTGQFTAVKTKSSNRIFQVDIRTWMCGHAVCICGVVAREGNDVVGLDLCHGRYGRSYPKFLTDKALFTNKTIVEHDDTGRNYVFKFPSSAYMKVQAGKSSTYMNVYIHVPSGFRRDTEGLCGFYDGNKDNDLTEKTGKVRKHPVMHFIESWRIDKGRSLFEKVEPVSSHMIPSSNFCNCTQASVSTSCRTPDSPGPPMQVLCPNCQPPVSVSTSTTSASTNTPATSTAAFSVNSLTTSTTASTSQLNTSPSATRTGIPVTSRPTGLVAYNYTYATVPTITPTPIIQPGNASVFCDKVLKAYKPARDCIENLYHLNVADITAMCVEDLVLTGDHEMAVSALSVLVEECAMEILKNTTSYNLGNGTSSLIAVCPGACTGKGQCFNGVCTCDVGFGGSDCSISLTSPPDLQKIVGGSTCDLSIEQCLFPTLVGENLYPGGTTCVLRPLEFHTYYVTMGLQSQERQSTFGSTNHVICPLPNSSPQPALSGYSIRLKSRGRESGEKFLTIYNSKCINCRTYQNCSQRVNTCLIENQCYLAGETDGLGRFCNPSESHLSWSSLQTSGRPDTTSTSKLPMPSVSSASHSPDIPTSKTTLSTSKPSSTAPLGGLKTPRPDIWTKRDSGCTCEADSSRSDCACCEAGGEQCPSGDMCVRAGDSHSCGTKKPSDRFGEDYWTATYSGCGCLFDFSRADCACCQNQGCPCSAANRNQCVDCLHTDRCGKKRWVFGPDFLNS